MWKVHDDIGCGEREGTAPKIIIKNRRRGGWVLYRTTTNP